MKERFKFKCLLPKEEAQNLWRETRRKLGLKLRGLRQEERLRFFDVCDSLGFRVNDLDGLENGEGRLRLDMLLYLCRFYGVRLVLTTEYVSGINLNRDEELEEAEIFRANQPKEEVDDDVK